MIAPTPVTPTNDPIPFVPVPAHQPGVAEAWHDVTCPEGPQCRDRSMHARSASMVNSGVLDRFVAALPAPAGESARRAGVRAFHEACGVENRDVPQVAIPDRALRLRLLREEMVELHAAVAAGDIVETADALGDIGFLADGDGLVYGIDLDVAGAEVLRSNMTKRGPDGKVHRRADGKVIKPETFSEPDLAGVLGIPRDVEHIPMIDAPPAIFVGRLDVWDAPAYTTPEDLEGAARGTVVVDARGRSWTRGGLFWWSVVDDVPVQWDSSELIAEVADSGPLTEVWTRPES